MREERGLLVFGLFENWEGRESRLLSLTLLISCAAYGGNLLFDGLEEGCCTTDADGAEAAACLLDTGFCCGELEMMNQH